MPEEFYFIAFTLIFLMTYLPVYLQKRKLWRMADEDLKKIDRGEWRKQIRSNAYIRFINCLLWGLFVLSGFIFRYDMAMARGFTRLGALILTLGLAIIVWGFVGFRLDMRKISALD